MFVSPSLNSQLNVPTQFSFVGVNNEDSGVILMGESNLDKKKSPNNLDCALQKISSNLVLTLGALDVNGEIKKVSEFVQKFY